MGDINYIKKAKKTVGEMLFDRGYANNPIINDMLKKDDKYKKIPLLELINDAETEITLLHFIVTELGEKSSKFKKDDLLKLHDTASKLQKESQKKIIVIVIFTIKMSSQIVKEKHILNEKNKQSNIPIIFEFWNADNLQFNISRNNLVPKHEIMEPSEVEQLKINYQIKNLVELPRIKHNDPMVRYLGAQIGQVIRIKRISETTGYTNYYRLVS